MLLFETINAHQRTAAIQAAIDLDLFSAVGEGEDTAQAIARRCEASERGVRILADYLAVLGFLTKEEGRYRLTPDSAVFLDRRSPAYMGGITRFLLSPMLTEAFKDLAATVRKGGTTMSAEGSVAPEHPAWIDFARAMAPMMAMPAQALAQMVDADPSRELKILDIAAGHGLFGIAFAQRNPKARVVALDWPRVLDVARENAQAAGVADRYRTLKGSAFEVDYGSGYDLVLLTNFLHHFDVPTCETLLRKVHASLAEGGRAVALEFVPDEARTSPATTFSLIMLASTPAGDAYTFSELESMFRAAGFGRCEMQPVPASIEHAVIAYR